MVRSYTLYQKVKLIKRLSTQRKILDFGCGTGEFLLQCKKNHFDVTGFEPNPTARMQAEAKGIPTISQLKQLKGQFDIITAWHVIEHVSELKKTIKVLKKKLTDQGLLIIALPNLQSYDARYYKEYWAAYDVPRHLYHFSQESFGTLLAKTKLKLQDTIPMYFDAFYVAMLSEKYKHQKLRLLSALKVGRRSNKEAKNTGEYSSLIYLISK